MSKHTPEPWEAFLTTGRIWPKGLGPYICSVRYNPRTKIAEANTAHIVACVNGCAGINPAAVPDLLEALNFILPGLVEEPDPGFGWHAEIQKAQAAIAKAVPDA